MIGSAEIAGDSAHGPSLPRFNGDEAKYLPYWKATGRTVSAIIVTRRTMARGRPSLAVFFLAILPVVSQPDRTVETFRSSVPPPDARLFKAVRDAKDWKNPYVMVLADGLQLRQGSRDQFVSVKLEEIAETLLKLPRKDWPYGRVVAVSYNSLRTGDKDAADEASNASRLEAELKRIGVVANWWP